MSEKQLKNNGYKPISEYDKENSEEYEVIGYSKKWIHPDFNPKGLRICFKGADNWFSAVWNNCQDSYWGDDETAPTHYKLIDSFTNG